MRQYLSDKDHHRVSASVMKAEVPVKRKKQDLYLDRVTLEEQQVAEELWLWEVLIVTGLAGHTLAVQLRQDAP